MGGRSGNGLRNSRNLISSPSDTALSYREATEWLQNSLGYTQEEARELLDAMETWSNYGYRDIHSGSSNKAKETKTLDKYLEDPRLAKTKGSLYRGLTVKTSEVDKIDSMLKSGKWKEPGITGFSSSKQQADLYASADSTSSEIHITMLNNSHAVQIGHLSVGGGEQESLYPSSIKSGIPIASYTKTPVYAEKLDRAHFRATGERRYKKVVLKYIYDITLDDRRKR